MPTQPKYPPLTDAEKQRLLVDWNNTIADYPRDRCLHQLFEAQAVQTPDRVALIFEERRLTYRQLNERANRLAHFLTTQGVGPETMVGLCANRSFEMVVGVLAVLKAGGAYVPLDPNYPQARLNFILTDTQAPVLLTQPHLADRFPEFGGQLVFLDRDLVELPRTNPTCQVNPKNAAYVLYTSGSTGQPKGVVGLHRVAVNRVSHEPYPIGPDELFAQKTSLNFIDSIWEIFTPLSRGLATLVVPEHILTDPIGLVDILAKHGVTRLVFVPSLLRLLLNSGIDLQDRLPKLRYWISSGEILPVHLARRLADAWPGAILINLYGTSEIWDATWHPFDPATDQVRVPIGRPLANVEVYILDDRLQPVPVGAEGELHIGGAGLARGYHNQPELTAERFMPHPFGREPGARLYRTGDLARYLPDGRVEFLGRIDHQVKIRGFRIELGEIEATLARHPAVKEAVVTAWDDGPDGTEKRLAAYWVSRQPPFPTVTELRRFLQAKLPDYMVPAALMRLDALPLTPNGKIDRRALPAPALTRPDLAQPYEPPRSQIEALLIDLWAEVLGLEQIGIYDNFFELGGDSLLATQLISRLRIAGQVEFPVQQLFARPTIALMAEQVETFQARIAAPPDQWPIQPVARDGDLPLSFAQQRLWFLDQFEPDLPVYNLPYALRFSGSLDADALEQSLNEIVRRHEVLRTTFAGADGGPYQVIAPTLKVALPLLDLQALPAAEQQHQVRQQTITAARRLFDLARGPLLRASLLKLGPAEHILLLTIHHIVFDGWSESVLTTELAALYQAFAAGKSSPLPELSIQYIDFAHWQRQWLRGDSLEAQLAYWRQQLGGRLPVLQLPTDRPRPPRQTYRGASHPFQLPTSLTVTLKTFSRQQSVTLYMTLLAALNVLLCRYTGRTDILVGTPVANRNRRELEELIGFFVNTLVLRTDLSDDPTFLGLLDRVRQVALEAYNHQDIPFEKLVELLQPERHLSHSPLFQVMFVFQNTPPETPSLPGLTLAPLEVDTGTAKFDLTLEMTETGEGLRGRWIYRTDLFEAATIARLSGHWQTLLQAIAAEPTQALSDLPLLTEIERQQILIDWNLSASEAADEEPACIHHLFESQVAKTPDAIAVVFEEEQLTYDQLNHRANQLAHYLQTFGVGPEKRVGLFLERSVDMIVAMLGVLKAGGAYVPLDPELQPNRLKLILSDIQTPVLVTQPHLADRLSDQEAQVLCLDTVWSESVQTGEENYVSAATAENLIYVLFTSGSTGQPKGVMVEHRQLFNYLQAILPRLDLLEGASYAMVSTFAADLGNTAIFAALSTGGCLHIISRARATNPAALADYFQRHPIDCLKIVPSHLAALLDSPRPDHVLPRRRLVLGGEVCDWTLVERVRSLAPECRILNHYGPTETTVGVLTYQIPQDRPANHTATVPIGRPLANTQVYLLDSHMQPVPVGVPGELYIGGANVSRGYLNRPDLTAERFIPNPFIDEIKNQRSSREGAVLPASSSRLYRTGDLARYLPDGNLEFLGRTDQQVKIRGFRVELDEIAIVLSRHPAIREAAIITREHSSDGVSSSQDTRLVAYLVPAELPAPARSDLRHYLGGQLPDYMIPSDFVWLESLPLTPNGKLDRQALPPPEHAKPTTADGYIAPRNPLELQLVQIWEDTLDVHPVGITDDFFKLGGHSLLAVRLIARMQQRLGQDVPLTTLFQMATIESLAATFNQGRYDFSQSPLVPFQPAGSDFNGGRGLKLRPPLFCVHGASGHVLSYVDLARHLGPDRPFYGLQTVLDQDSSPDDQIELLAARYIQALRTVQPTGPYLLGGWSMGGVVAFEMAQQLYRQGDRVALLALLDSAAPSATAPKNDTQLLLDFLGDLRGRFARTLELPPLPTDFHSLCPDEQLNFVLDQAKMLESAFPDGGLTQLHQLLKVFKANVRAVWNYQPQVYPGQLLLFQAVEQASSDDQSTPDEVVDRVAGWAELSSSPVEVQTVPGNHQTMLTEPNVKILAQTLSTCLDKSYRL